MDSRLTVWRYSSMLMCACAKRLDSDHENKIREILCRDPSAKIYTTQNIPAIRLSLRPGIEATSTEIVGVAMVGLRMLSRSRAMIGLLLASFTGHFPSGKCGLGSRLVCYVLVSPMLHQEELFLEELI